jgi:DNA-binding transcriptional ArsR family regulator
MNSLTALADPTRQQIVRLLAKGALSSGDIARQFAMTPPAVSQHLKTLREARLVTVRAKAQKRFYELDPEGVGEVAEWVNDLRKFWDDKFDRLAAELGKEKKI